MRIAQFPIENRSEQAQFAELSLKTIGQVQNLGDYYALRSAQFANGECMDDTKLVN
jgi:hypothetical protein